MLLKWLPWKFIASRLARHHGFLDPTGILARLERLAQPSEVAAPIELLRAGMALHARGLVNTKVIQQNIDWVWPWWVQRQFDPADESFVPRAFSITHINLTHRNWTAAGAPGCYAMPIVDPRGLVTPFFDGWSIDMWILPDQGQALLPARSCRVEQQLDCSEGLAVVTRAFQDEMELTSRLQVQAEGKSACARIDCTARAAKPGWLIASIRPFNPEGVSFVHHIAPEGPDQLAIERASCLRFDRPMDRHVVSQYRRGDVYDHLPGKDALEKIHCDVGLASSAAMFRLDPDGQAELSIRVDLSADEQSRPIAPGGPIESWPDALEGTARLECPDRRFVELYDAAVRTLLVLNPRDPLPGPYTYKRFWFRDAAYFLYAMLAAGMTDRVTRSLERFPARQSATGYFHSQEGEWDSNGQVLWLLKRYAEMTGRKLDQRWLRPVRSAARWIRRKRIDVGGDSLHAGLLPAGFSAEHLGNNDYYYWDDYWSLAGLQAAAEMLDGWDRCEDAQLCRNETEGLRAAIRRSLDKSRSIRKIDAIPASPHRRMDAGAVGSIVAGYPLQLLEPDDPQLLATADWLCENCFVDGAFFQQMIHSGLNAYLTLHIAQVYLRAGREEYWPLVKAVARIASPTGQWPEAVHPRTGGGCMGDGQHGWAAAEWVLMARNMFCREDREDDVLILASGVPRSWLVAGQRLKFGPTPTMFGPVTVTIDCEAETIRVGWQGQWHNRPAEILVQLPGRQEHCCKPAVTGQVELDRGPQSEATKSYST
ncbi:MAG: hypothetical protein ACLFUJ_12370 [Phycisphaerae bacterium]